MNREQLQLGGRQGRDDPRSVNASRAALGLRPLDGGNYHPELDTPVVSPEEMEAMAAGVTAFLFCVLACCIAAWFFPGISLPF